MNAKYSRKGHFLVPTWLFLGILVAVYESFLHLGTMDNFLFPRFAAILAFSAGFSTLLSLILSFLPAKAQKITTVVVMLILALLYIVQYFIHDAYQVFMNFASVLNGAEGVATNYLDVVLGLLARNLWKILLLILPAVLYARFCQPSAQKNAGRLALLGAMVVCYVLGFGTVHLGKVDAAKLSLSSSFDNAVEAFGLNVGLGIDLLQGTTNSTPDFDVQVQKPTEQPTEAPTSAPTEAPVDSTDSQTEPTAAPTEPPKVYGPHALDLDFEAMAEAESNKQIAAIHSYMASLEPAMENDYTGLFEGKNLIFITAEAFSSFVVDPELSPTLYRMATEGIEFTDYYQPVWGAGTTGGEYTNLLSLIPYGGSASMQEVNQQDIFQTIGKYLQARGYVSAAFHNNDYTYYSRHQTHTQLGYDVFIGVGNGMEEGISAGWPQSDEEMFRFTIPDYVDQDKPFSLYYMTVSGHATYLFNSNTAARRNQDKVEHLSYSQPVRAYLACSLELENSMAYLLEELESRGIADDTVVVIATDHYPYGLAPSDTWGTNADYLSELYGEKVKNGFIRDKSTLIIWSGCLEGQNIVVDTPTQSLDILPTLCNLFGVEYDSRLMCGRDVFSEQQPVAFWIDYSWKTEKGSYNSSTGVFTPVEGVEVSDDYISYMHSYVRNKFTFSKAVHGHNYFNYITAALNESQEG